MELRDALTQITEIRLQLARTEVFRGYRAMPVAFSGGVAVLAAVIQAVTIADPAAADRPVSGVLDRGRGRERPGGGPGDDDPCAQRRLDHDPRADLAGARAILPVLDRRGAGDDRPGAGRAGEPVDAAGPLADLLQPGDLRLVPAAAPADLLGGRLLSRNRPGRAGPGRTARRRFLPGRWACRSERANCWPPPCFIAPWSAIMPQPKAKAGESNGRFAYEGLERVFHEKARLGIMTSLVSQPRGVVFADLKELCHLTDGNLSRHLQVLNEAGLVEIWKGFHKNRPQTLCRITDEGRRRFFEYINVLETVVHDAMNAARDATPPTPNKRESRRRLVARLTMTAKGTRCDRTQAGLSRPNDFRADQFPGLR